MKIVPITISTTSEWTKIELDNGSFFKALGLTLEIDAMSAPIQKFIFAKRHLLIEKGPKKEGLIKISTHVNCDSPYEDLLEGRIFRGNMGWTKFITRLGEWNHDTNIESDPDNEQSFQAAITLEGLDKLLGV
jgi:hypothetical protein